MGVNWDCVGKMDELGLFEYQPCRILDIGSSNLYCAKASEIVAFVRRHNLSPRRDLDNFALRLERGSAFTLETGGTNEAFIGEVFEQAGMQYESIDIAQSYKTTVVDLNREKLPAHFTKAFDLVLNFGTTEHIINQMNAFRAIHEATAKGGHMYHQLPAVGFVDHGYYSYTGRFFFDLAGYNGYEIVDVWFESPDGLENIFRSLRSYQDSFPALVRALARTEVNKLDRRLDAMQIPIISINVVYRKLDERPFVLPVETSTSVGEIPLDLLMKYVKDTVTEEAQSADPVTEHQSSG